MNTEVGVLIEWVLNSRDKVEVAVMRLLRARASGEPYLAQDEELFAAWLSAARLLSSLCADVRDPWFKEAGARVDEHVDFLWNRAFGYAVPD